MKLISLREMLRLSQELTPEEFRGLNIQPPGELPDPDAMRECIDRMVWHMLQEQAVLQEEIQEELCG